MAKQRVLIIEDEKGLTESLKWTFEWKGYEVHVVCDGKEGLKKAQTMLPDIILLDVMLPGMNGNDVCRELRKSGSPTEGIPIIMMSARSGETDQVVGYAMGTDDYVTKPFSNKVLLAKVNAMLRREPSAGEPGEVTDCLGVKIDRVRRRVTVNDVEVDLTPTELRLLDCMIRQPGRAFNRHWLMDACIGEGAVVLERTIDAHVKTLRKKLTKASGNGDELIETVRGVGYRFREGPLTKEQKLTKNTDGANLSDASEDENAPGEQGGGHDFTGRTGRNDKSGGRPLR